MERMKVDNEITPAQKEILSKGVEFAKKTADVEAERKAAWFKTLREQMDAAQPALAALFADKDTRAMTLPSGTQRCPACKGDVGCKTCKSTGIVGNALGEAKYCDKCQGFGCCLQCKGQGVILPEAVVACPVCGMVQGNHQQCKIAQWGEIDKKLRFLQVDHELLRRAYRELVKKGPEEGGNVLSKIVDLGKVADYGHGDHDKAIEEAVREFWKGDGTPLPIRMGGGLMKDPSIVGRITALGMNLLGEIQGRIYFVKGSPAETRKIGLQFIRETDDKPLIAVAGLIL